MSADSIRTPAVAGRFYPAEASALTPELQQLMPPQPDKRRVIGLIGPHAGYVFSGECAGLGYSRVIIPDTVVILGVNHSGRGPDIAVDSHDGWQTPLGVCAIDTDLRRAILERSPIFQLDSAAGRSEHSLEVHVPFIQFGNPQAKIVPITVAEGHLKYLLEAGQMLGEIVSNAPGVMLVASTDMSHYISAARAKDLDFKAIHHILQLDPAGLFNTVAANRISMCGVLPVTLLLAAAVAIGATKAELVHYTNSGVVTGDDSEVVAYASLIVY